MSLSVNNLIQKEINLQFCFLFFNTEPKSEGHSFVVLTVNKFLEVEESRVGSLEAAHEETNLVDFPADILELQKDLPVAE